MKKTFTTLLTLSLLLSACNLPTGQTNPNPDDIATRVAATLASAPQGDTTANPNPAEGQLTFTATVSPESATPTATATETVTPTPTQNPNDPKLTLGSPNFWFNAASSGDPFGVAGDPYEDTSIVISNEVGGLQFASKGINGGKRWRLTSPTPTDFYLEGTFKINVCSGKDNYGLVMRVPSYSSTLGYFVGLSCDGNYIVDRIDAAGNGTNIRSWTADSHINTGSGQINRLGVMMIGNTMTIYINGEMAGTLTDLTITTAGHIGAYISARSDPNFTIVLQELLQWNR